MENAKINVEKLMAELKETAAQRQYAKEAVDFEVVIHAGEEHDRPFYFEDFKDELRDGHQECYVEYDLPLEGKGRSLKKMIRKLYRFHMKPLWDKQNDVNIEVFALLNQVKNYIGQMEKKQMQKDQKIARLEKMCGEYESRLKKLEEVFKEVNQV